MMKSRLLLPHELKKIGFIISPVGFIVWALTQLNILFSDAHHLIKALVLTLSACMFVFGFFFSVFAKEKIEDEFIRNNRLETFQLSAILQVVLVIVGFFLIGFNKNPMRIDYQLLYFIGCLFFFYLFYIIRFNYVIRRNRLPDDEE